MTRNKALICSKYLVITLIFLVILSCTITSAEIPPKCPKGFFLVGDMINCHKLLTCADFMDVKYVKLIGYGAVKWVFLASWNNVQISISILRQDSYIQDFHDGLSLMKSFPPSRYINQLVGYCDEVNIFATEYQPINNANSLTFILQRKSDSALPLRLCMNYIELLSFMHDSPLGVRVNCDSDSVEKILSQILVTQDMTLLLADVDALPEISPNVTITCGRSNPKKSNSLVPPELVATHNRYHIGYTVKSDVWKAPDVCNYLFRSSGMDFLQYSLYDVHKKCKIYDPLLRLTSSELLHLYRERFRHILSVTRV